MEKPGELEEELILKIYNSAIGYVTARNISKSLASTCWMLEEKGYASLRGPRLSLTEKGKAYAREHMYI